MQIQRQISIKSNTVKNIMIQVINNLFIYLKLNDHYLMLIRLPDLKIIKQYRILIKEALKVEIKYLDFFLLNDLNFKNKYVYIYFFIYITHINQILYNL